MTSVWRGGTIYFFLGLFIGSTVTAIPLAILGLTVDLVLPETLRTVLAVPVIAVLSVIELGGRGDRLPQNRRVVPQSIYLKGRRTGALQFGFELGTGVRTYITNSLPWIAVATAIFQTHGLSEPFLLSVGFSIGRALTVPAIRLGSGSNSWANQVDTHPRRFALPSLAASTTVAIMLTIS